MKFDAPENSVEAITWARFMDEFDKEMETRASSRKTCISYNQAWKFFKRWFERCGPHGASGPEQRSPA